MSFSSVEQKIKFPVIGNYSNEFLTSNFWKCNFLEIEQELQYWIILPNNVKPIEITKTKNKALNIYELGFYARVDNSPYLEVSVAYENIKYELNCSDWLKKKLYLMGESTIKERTITGKYSGIYLDILTYKKSEGGEEIISRFSTIKSHNPKGGANYFMVKISALLKNYDELADKIFHISSHWDLINKSKWQMAEMLKTFKYNFNESVEFYYPYSWNAKYDENNNVRLSRFVFECDIDGNNSGVINFYCSKISNFNSAQEVFDNNFKRIESLNDYTIDKNELIDIGTNDINNKISALYTVSGTISSKNLNFNACIIIFIIKTQKSWYYFENIGSKPNLQNYNWEKNKRSLQLIINSFNNLDFEGVGNNQLNQDLKNMENSYKTYKGKKYTEQEWEKFEQEQFEHYARKNNILLEDEKPKKEGRFFLDEKEGDY